MSFVCRSYAIRMSFLYQSYVLVCHSYIIRMTLACTLISFVCNSHVLIFYLHLPVCHWYVIRLLVSHPYVTRIYSYQLVYHSCVIRMYSYVIRASLVYTCMSFVCHSYVLVCHLHVTHMWFYHELCTSFNANNIYADIVNPDVWTKCIWLIIDTRYRDNMNIVTFSCINFKPIQSNKPP